MAAAQKKKLSTNLLRHQGAGSTTRLSQGHSLSSLTQQLAGKQQSSIRTNSTSKLGGQDHYQMNQMHINSTLPPKQSYKSNNLSHREMPLPPKNMPRTTTNKGGSSARASFSSTGLSKYNRSSNVKNTANPELDYRQGMNSNSICNSLQQTSSLVQIPTKAAATGRNSSKQLSARNPINTSTTARIFR